MKNQIKLLSLDTSSTITGWAIYENAQYKNSGNIDLHKEKDSDKRIQAMCLSIIELLEKNKPDIVVIEKLNVGRNMVAVRALCKVIGAVYCYSILNNIFYYEIEPSQWRKQLGMQKTGRKREEYKQLSIAYVKSNYGKEVLDDEADAICAGIGYIKMFT